MAKYITVRSSTACATTPRAASAARETDVPSNGVGLMPVGPFLSMALTTTAHAQALPKRDYGPQSICNPISTAESGRLSRLADFFAPFSPQTALDMVRQTPGFTLDSGDDRRGFSGATGNVPIEGVRPSAKSRLLEDILSRIPVIQVVRIELLRGAAAAGDASGQAVLLNVVRTATAGADVWEAGFEYNVDRLTPRGEASYSGRNGQVEYGLGASIFTVSLVVPTLVMCVGAMEI